MFDRCVFVTIADIHTQLHENFHIACESERQSQKNKKNCHSLNHSHTHMYFNNVLE